MLLSPKNKLASGRYHIQLQLRCIAINNDDGILTHSFPKFGHFRLNRDGNTHKSYKIEKPPNDRKRKD